MVDSLGRNILDKLNEFVPPLLQLALTLFAGSPVFGLYQRQIKCTDSLGTRILLAETPTAGFKA